MSWMTALMVLGANVLLIFVSPQNTASRVLAIGIINGIGLSVIVTSYIIRTLKCDDCGLAPDSWICGECGK